MDVCGRRRDDPGQQETDATFLGRSVAWWVGVMGGRSVVSMGGWDRWGGAA